ncbi:MAG: double-strand break repair helicase AddA [Alphaproteobacteria bacterium]
MIQLSTSQTKAVDPQLSCWVEASAGTGKTKVLVDRVLSLLLHGAPAKKILCLTFTKAAAAEMSERIQQKLAFWSRCESYELRKDLAALLGTNPEETHLKLSRSLFAQLIKGENIKIQTVHAFCQFLLKTFPLEIGLMPHFQIMDDSYTQKVKKEVFHQILKQTSEQDMDLISTYVSLTTLEDIFLQSKEQDVLKFLLSENLSRLQENLVKLLGVNLAKAEQDLKKEFLNQHLLEKIPSDLGAPDILNKSVEEKLKDWNAYEVFFLTEKRTVRQKLRGKDFKEQFQDYAPALADHADHLYDFVQTLKRQTVANLTICFYQLGKTYAHLYATFKEKNSKVDYDDLIDKSIHLLKEGTNKPWIFYKLDGGIDHVLIDEAQDTSHAQWTFIKHLVEEFFSPHSEASHHRTLFVVGDSKQSIYSFQGASPLTFQQMKELFGDLVQKAGRKWEVVDLSTSYRSTEAILKFVDTVFTGTPLLQKYKEHILHREGHGGRVEVWPLLVGDDNQNAHDPWNIPSPTKLPETARYKMANSIAITIGQWLADKKWLHSRNRPIEPQDIMILVRHRDSFLHDLVRALKHNNIPVSGVDRMVLKDEIAIQDLLALGDFCLLPTDDLTLATVLKGPFFNWTEEQLFDLASNREDSCLWEALQSNELLKATYDHLSEIKTLAKSHGPAIFYGTILSYFKGRQKLTSQLGADVEDALEEFLNLCFHFESQQGMSLQKFQFWMQQNDAEIKRSLQKNSSNQVRLMTIHGSKGLQAPIVFLPDTTQLPTNSSRFYWTQGSSSLPLWVPKSELKSGVESYVQEVDALDEYYRLLYVAMTRAEDELYVGGWAPKRNLDEKSWYTLLAKSIEIFGAPAPTGWSYETLDTLNIRKKLVEKKESDQLELTLVPEWVHAAFSYEEPKKITPSTDTTKESTPSSSYAQEKGTLVHQILQWIFKAPKADQQNLITEYLDKIDWPTKEKKDLENSIHQLLSNKDWDRYINADSLKEVPIEGWKQGQKIRGIIDVLTIHEDTKQIFIVDYKTGRFLENYARTPPPEYTEQLALYESVLQDIYPDYIIKKILLWTEPGIMQVL